MTALHSLRLAAAEQPEGGLKSLLHWAELHIGDQYERICELEDELKQADTENQRRANALIAGQKLMYCGIKMDNGFVAVGKPATCISPENWRDEIGQKISYDNTFDELWTLEAYRLLSGA